MNKSVVYLFVSVFFLFTSCEYRLGENFMDFEKWQAELDRLSKNIFRRDEPEGKTRLLWSVYP